MERKSVGIATLLVLLGLGGVGYATRDKWGSPVEVAGLPQQTPAAPAQAEPPKATAAPEAKPAEQRVATAETPKAVETPSAPPAAIQQPPVAEAPAAADNAPLPNIGTVRIEKDGSAVIAGRAEPGATVTVKLNDKVVASGTANEAGDYAIIPDKPLPQEAGVLTVEMAGKDGKTVASEQTVAVIGRAANAEPQVVVLTPGAPTKFVQSGEPGKAKLPPMATVMIDTVDYDDKGNMVFSGRGPAGSKVQLYADNKPVADGMIGADGTWTITPPPANLALGPHELRADEIAADGSVKSRVGMPFYREDPAKVLAAKAPPPAPQTVTINQQVTITTPDKQTVVTATGPVTVEVKQSDTTTARAEAPAAQPPAGQSVATAQPPAAPAAEQPTTPAAEPAAQPEQPAAAAATEQPAAPATVAPAETKVATAAPAVDPDALEKSTSKVIIQPGNSLWKLSRRIYGKGTMYTVIYEANRDFIKNPNLIYPGQIFTAPKSASGQ